jgi:hypothetical protein
LARFSTDLFTQSGRTQTDCCISERDQQWFSCTSNVSKEGP